MAVPMERDISHFVEDLDEQILTRLMKVLDVRKGKGKEKASRQEQWKVMFRRWKEEKEGHKEVDCCGSRKIVSESQMGSSKIHVTLSNIVHFLRKEQWNLCKPWVL